MKALGATIREARSAGMLVIVDGKRNDIASTAEAYASAYLGVTPAFGSQTRAFAADALTVNPYLGWDSLVPFARTARDHGNGLFLLVHTSNLLDRAPGIERERHCALHHDGWIRCSSRGGILR